LSRRCYLTQGQRGNDQETLDFSYSVGKEPEKNTDVPDPMTQLQTGYLTRSGRTYKVRKGGEGGGTKFRDPQLTGGERTKPIGLHDRRMKLISNTMQYQYHAIPCKFQYSGG